MCSKTFLDTGAALSLGRALWTSAGECKTGMRNGQHLRLERLLAEALDVVSEITRRETRLREKQRAGGVYGARLRWGKADDSPESASDTNKNSGTRIPNDFSLTDARLTWAVEHFEFFHTQGVFEPVATFEMKQEAVRIIFEKFKSTWLQSSEPSAWKRDWDRAWRVWCQQWPTSPNDLLTLTP